MKKAILATKVGMTQIFDENGVLVPVTVLQAGPCVVTQVKTADNDGYSAIQVGFGEKKENRVNKPMKGQFAKAGVSCKRYLKEFRFEDAETYTLGQEIKADIFGAGDKIDATATSKGKGFQGAIKRHGQSRGPMAHGSKYHRHAGSNGACSDPSKVFKGKRMPGQMEVEAFAAAVSKRNELDNPMVQRLLRLKLQALNSQKAQIKALREELHSIRETQKEYSHEYYLMGNECITKAHDANAAIRCFDKALNLNPNYVEAWVRKGVTLLDIGEDYDAQVCLNKAVKLSPKSFKARYNRGKCLLKLKYYDEAILDFQQAISIKPKHAASHEYLAEGFRAIGEDELAQQHQDIADALRGGEDI